MDKRIYLLAFVNFVLGCVEVVPAGILCPISRDLGVSVSAAGQMLGIFSLVFAVSAPVLQVVTARFERKAVFLCALVVFAASCLWSALAPDYSSSMAARGIQAASSGVMSAIGFSLAAQLSDPAYRGRAIAVCAMGVSCAVVVGIPLGIMMTNSFGWRANYLLVMGPAAFCALGVIAWLPQQPGHVTVPLRMQLHTLSDIKLLSAHAVTVLLMWGHFTIYAFLAPFLERVAGIGPHLTSVVYLLFGTAGMLGGWLGGYSSDRWGGGRSALIGGCLLALSLLILPFAAGSLWLLLPVVAVWGMTSWGVTPSMQHYITINSPETAGIQLGLNLSAIHLGLAIGAAVGGVAMGRLPVSYNAWIGAAVVVLAVLAIYYSIRQPKKTRLVLA
ncbi:MFS transporter [Crenobacter sp. SG2305]|uniref:MFS transporter n=1 Tax=Crenobacter oryzisoli TaxID=3056844 RepID=UPI0025AADEFD|nr:MFS transporter [Crenobacter sp. SG2305]MDN0082001.1 MFS transporter [Crenobacter sp. SG2305]